MGDVIVTDDVKGTFDFEVILFILNMNVLIITDPKNYHSGLIPATPHIWRGICLAGEGDTCY